MTLKELKTGSQWRSILRLLAKKSTTIRVMDSPLIMGQYSAVVLNGQGFQIESGRGGMAAAYAGNKPEFESIKTTKEVLATVMAFNEPLEDEPATSRPSESDIVAEILRQIEEIRQKK